MFPPWPLYEVDEIEAVVRVLASGKVNYWSGDEGRNFEREFAIYHGMPYAVAVANGTVALELALYALGIGPGHEVVVTPRTFVASVSSVVLSGAIPVFADVDPNSGNITPDTVRQVITGKTKAIMTVHLGGWPCDMNGFKTLADEHGLILIEDCAQAHGARIDGRLAGSFGDAAAFSFCTDKIMSTGGEGGMVLFRKEDAWRRAWGYKDHGKNWDAVYNRDHPPGFRWLHESFGTNWRLTEMQAAIGRLQLQKLDGWIKKRRQNADFLIEGFSGICGLRVPVPGKQVAHSWYRFYVYVRPERLKDGWDRDAVMQSAVRLGIPCMQGICPEVYLEKAFNRRGKTAEIGMRQLEDGRLRPANRLPVARELGENSLMFTVHPTLGAAEMKKIVEVMTMIMKRATA